VGSAARKFLVIDDNVDNRFLLTRTLRRKYPGAEVEECGDLSTAIEITNQHGIDAVVSHRAGEVDGLELVRQLRKHHPILPIIMVSGFDRTREALAAGATRFLNYDEWLRLGTVMDEIFTTQPWAAIVGQLTYAIQAHTIVTFEYALPTGAMDCEVEPHLLGEAADGRFILRAYRIGWGRQRGEAGWETYLVEAIRRLAITERIFAPHNGQKSEGEPIARVWCHV
jgi:CheY-like chemotaxis protein